MSKNTIVISGKGEVCPRCKKATEIHAHQQITPKLLGQPYYYSRWYRCVNPNCQTTLIMPEKFKVLNPPVVGAKQPGSYVSPDIEKVRFGTKTPWRRSRRR